MVAPLNLVAVAKLLPGTIISNKTKVKMLNADFAACEGLRIEILRTGKINVNSFFNSFRILDTDKNRENIFNDGLKNYYMFHV